jgi:hypothetical protein
MSKSLPNSQPKSKKNVPKYTDCKNKTFSKCKNSSSSLKTTTDSTPLSLKTKSPPQTKSLLNNSKNTFINFFYPSTLHSNKETPLKIIKLNSLNHSILIFTPWNNKILPSSIKPELLMLFYFSSIHIRHILNAHSINNPKLLKNSIKLLMLVVLFSGKNITKLLNSLILTIQIKMIKTKTIKISTIKTKTIKTWAFQSVPRQTSSVPKCR